MINLRSNLGGPRSALHVYACIGGCRDVTRHEVCHGEWTSCVCDLGGEQVGVRELYRRLLYQVWLIPSDLIG